MFEVHELSFASHSVILLLGVLQYNKSNQFGTEMADFDYFLTEFLSEGRDTLTVHCMNSPDYLHRKIMIAIVFEMNVDFSTESLPFRKHGSMFDQFFFSVTFQPTLPGY